MSAPSSSASSGMNLAQQEAVNFLHGPCLVLAGAGSGKTRVITHKIARLIQTGMPAKRIAAITFTNKAAAEMRERAKSLIGKPAKDVVVCTFHSLGVRMLRQDGAVLGLKPSFSIIDTDDVTSILKDAGGTVDAATARAWQWTISGWKSAGLNAEQALAAAENDNERQAAVVMGRYQERLTAYQSVDFDDLISLPLKLLQNHSEVRHRWQAQMGHVLVDEYQDTNATQYEMLKLLVGETADAPVVGDAVRIKQIISNLVSNAVKFTRRGRVQVTADLTLSEDGDAVATVVVEDTGIGFDAEMAAKLFVRFEQGDGSITRTYGGTGLGLSISQSLAQLMGGTISAESTPGVGSRFTLTLPLQLSAAAPTLVPVAQEAPLATDFDAMRVLLAEDHPTNQRVVRLILEPYGVDLTIAADGVEALQALEQARFDVILMDIQMPNLDGFAAARILRRSEASRGLPRTPILVFTANAMPEHQQEAADAGGDGFIAKPVTPEDLLRGITSVLGQAEEIITFE